MDSTAGQFIEALASQHRVLVIGGLAVIAHGFNRPTKDAGVWLEPLNSASEWAEALGKVCDLFSGLSLHTLPGWREIAGAQIALGNPAQEVRDYAVECLREMAAEGDPFAQALLEDRQIPYSAI